MNNKYKIINPSINNGICPHCGIYAQFEWGIIGRFLAGDKFLYHDEYNKVRTSGYYYSVNNAITHCINCTKIIIFYEKKMIYPNNNLLLEPNIILDKYPKSKKLFIEALEVSPISPRAGLTLSRMCLESLTNDILEENKEKIEENFNKNIKKLSDLKIIDNPIIELLQDTRFIGNKATHNFNIIDTHDEPDLDDCLIVLNTINLILNNIKTMIDCKLELKNLKDKISNKNNNHK